MVFELGRLPPEVRQLIWEATLPDRRVFHVSKLTDAPRAANTERREQMFSFHIRHAPPAALGVCRESRAIALLRGYFLAPATVCTATRKQPLLLLPPPPPLSTGPWLNPQRDMLYLDRNMRYCLKAKTALNVRGLDRVLHIGLEWRAWFRDVARRPDGEDMSHRRWRTAMEPLLLHCPRAESLSFVLPRVRHIGGIPSGREPWRAEHHHCDLAQLPDDVQVPWERRPVQVANGALVGYPGTALSQLGGESLTVEWRVIRRQMETVVGLLQGRDRTETDDKESFHEPADERGKALVVQGWWLVRPEAPASQEGQGVREFWY
ncbi:hypothetical protein V2A60_007589 [Cordyceps javanica]|uniref:2EXR domain-containing protein n=1 Tax=Cordyceps javanica TaxID=43265 RepID=A0A545VAH1_9HYPO|nr:hypothetical protein IF1G_02783 [Cordyceps javanica]TQW09914.1 hypothetical protein IF2G_02704 [Cordyceps javanica]